jgi:hypothetical protein
MSADVELFVADRKDGERIVVAWREFHGFHYLDLRLFFRATDGTWKPTKKGLAVKLSELFNVADALNDACERARAVKR